jgi:hypothetical protein
MPSVKGSNVLGAVKMLRANRERAEKLLAPQHHHYLHERIMVASWYPEADQLELLRAVAAMLPLAPDPWMTMGRIAARGDLSSLYSYLVRPGDLKDTLRAATALWQTFHDTGELKIVLEAPGRAIATVRNYGASTREMCRVIGGYVTEVATVAGARDVATSKLSCTHDGAPQCSWRMIWR